MSNVNGTTAISASRVAVAVVPFDTLGSKGISC